MQKMASAKAMETHDPTKVKTKKRKEGKGKELTAYSFHEVVLQSKRRKETQKKNSHKDGRINRVMDTPAYFWLRFWLNFPN